MTPNNDYIFLVELVALEVLNEKGDMPTKRLVREVYHWLGKDLPKKKRYAVQTERLATLKYRTVCSAVGKMRAAWLSRSIF